MKTKFSSKKPLLHLLTAVLLLTFSSGMFAQKKVPANLKDFKVVVEKTETGIAMQSIRGSAWIDLTFALNNYRPQAIDEYGMTQLNKTSPNKQAQLADFLFTVTKTQEGILLKGLKGTAWTELSFSLRNNEKQAIDQFGMTKPD